MDKPDVDFIEGPVAGDLDRPEVGVAATRVRPSAPSPRSTTTCGCSTPASASRTAPTADGSSPARRPQQIVDRVLQLEEGTRFQVLAPVVRGRKGEYEGLLKELASQGFTRARVDGELIELGAASGERLARYENHTIEVVVDRLVRRPGIERRLTDSLETALRLAEGVAEVEIVPAGGRSGRPRDAHVLGAPRLHALRRLVRRAGAAQLLVQLAVRRVRALRRSRAPASRSIPSSSCPTTTSASATARSRRGRGSAATTSSACSTRSPSEFGFSTDTPWKKLKKKDKKVVLYGTGKTSVKVSYRNRYGRQRSYTTQFEGVVPWLERRHTESESDRAREQIEGYMREVPCPACGGARLRPASLAVTIGGKNIYEVGELSIRKASEFLGSLELSRTRPHDRGAGREGGQRAAAVPARRRPRLPQPQPVVGHAGRRGGAAHPARVADRQRARRRALRARRAVDRPAPARQPAPHRHA